MLFLWIFRRKILLKCITAGKRAVLIQSNWTFKKSDRFHWLFGFVLHAAYFDNPMNFTKASVRNCEIYSTCYYWLDIVVRRSGTWNYIFSSKYTKIWTWKMIFFSFIVRFVSLLRFSKRTNQFKLFLNFKNQYLELLIRGNPEYF